MLMQLSEIHADSIVATYRVIARGSEHLVCEVNRSRTVLVWTDIVQYPKLTSKDARKDATEGLPRFRYFVSICTSCD